MNQPGDKYEQEADAVADWVVRSTELPLAASQTNGRGKENKINTLSSDHQISSTAGLHRKSNSSAKSLPSITSGISTKNAVQPGSEAASKEEIHRKEELPEEQQSSLVLPVKISSVDVGHPIQTQSSDARPTDASGLQTQLNSTKGSGSPLPPLVNHEMSSSIGADFSEVRVHHGPQAAQMNQQLNARAFTHGSDVYFNAGEYKPGEQAGKHLLAHELTHVVQQGAAVSADINTKRLEVSRQAQQGNNLIQREKQKAGIVPNGEVEFRKGKIVFSYDWYMRHATKNKEYRVNVYSPEAWKAIVKKLRTKGYLAWVTDEQIAKSADDIYIQGSIADSEGGNIKLVGYTIVNLITTEFGLPKEKDFLFYHIGGEVLLLVKTSKVDFTDDKAINALVKEIVEELLAITPLKIANELTVLENNIYGILLENLGKYENQSIGKIVLDKKLLATFFGEKEWDDYYSKLKAGFNHAKRKAPPAPDWLTALEAKVEELVITEKYNNPQAEDLPDRFYVKWDKAQWRGIGEQKPPGQKRKIRARIRLNPKATASQVLNRIRKGLRNRSIKQEQRTVHKRTLRRQNVAKDYQWAEDIRYALIQRVYRDTKGWRKHRRSNAPDELALHIMDGQVYLLVTVVGRLKFDEQDEPVIPRKSALFPAPLKPEMKKDLNRIYHKVNTFALSLRRGPSNQKVEDSATTDYEGRIDESYPAYIKASDMRSDFRTVTNGEHQFFMGLNYFQRGYNDGIESISEASRNTVTDWLIFDLNSAAVRQAFLLPKKEVSVATEKSHQPNFSGGLDEKWLAERNAYQFKITQLFDSINNDPNKDRIKTFFKLPQYLRKGPIEGWKMSSQEKLRGQSYEMKMPHKEGDYILFAHTYFQYTDKRLTTPSVAAFIFRNLDTEKLAKQEAYSRPARMKVIQEQLKDKSLSGEQLVKLQQEQAQLAQLETKGYSLYDSFKDRREQIAVATRLYGKLIYYYFRYGKDNLKLLEVLNEHKDKKHPRDGQFLVSLWTQFMEEYGHSDAKGIINGLKYKVDQLKKQKKQVDNFTKRINSYDGDFADKDAVETPEVVMVSEVTGKAYPLLMLVGEASDEFLMDNYNYQFAKVDGKKIYIVADVTTKDTDRFVGIGSSKAAAIKDAFKQFGEDNGYGDGYLHYRIPGGPSDGVRNSPGFRRQVLDALAGIAAVAGIIALAFATVATAGLVGGLAIAAGVTAGVAGGVTAYNNISERIENNRFSFDVEFALDMFSIIGAFAAGAGVITKLSTVSKLGSTAAALSRVSNFLRLPTVLAIHSIADLGANAILMAIKVQKDLDAIEEDEGGLTDTQKAALRRQILSNALTSGAMLMMSTKGMGDDVSLIKKYIQERSPIVDRALPRYESLNHKTGITDRNGEFTVPLRKESGEPISRKQQAEEASLTAGQATPEAPIQVPKSDKDHAVVTESKSKIKPEDHVIQKLPEATVMQPKNGKDVKEVEVMYEQLITDSKTREAGVYYNSTTGEYIVIQGNEGMVYVEGPGGTKQSPAPEGYSQKWKEDIAAGESAGQWKLLAHYHPAQSETGFVADVNRLPSGANGDFAALVGESNLAGGTSRVSRIDYQTSKGREVTIFAYDPKAEQPFFINYPNPKTGEREVLGFKKIEDYHQWMKENHGVSLGEVPPHLAAEETTIITADPSADTLTDIPTASSPVSSSSTPVQAPSAPLPKVLTQRITRVRRRLKAAKVNHADAERLVVRGMQDPDPETFFKAVQTLLKKNRALHREVLRGVYSTSEAEYIAANFLAKRLAKGGTYPQRVKDLLRHHDLEEIGRGVQYIRTEYKGLQDGWIFYRLENLESNPRNQEKRSKRAIRVWGDQPMATKGQLDFEHQVIEKGKGEALIEQGVKGDIGEYQLTLETLRTKFKNLPERELVKRVDLLFRHEFSNQKRPKSVRRALARFGRDGDVNQLLHSLPAAGAIEVVIVLPNGRVRRVDHLRSENGRPVFRENKNVALLSAKPDSHIRAEIEKDIALLLRYPDSVVEWRMTNTDKETAGLSKIADQSFLDYVRDTTIAAGVADRFVLMGDDISTTVLMLSPVRTTEVNTP